MICLPPSQKFCFVWFASILHCDCGSSPRRRCLMPTISLWATLVRYFRDAQLPFPATFNYWFLFLISLRLPRGESGEWSPVSDDWAAYMNSSSSSRVNLVDPVIVVLLHHVFLHFLVFSELFRILKIRLCVTWFMFDSFVSMSHEAGMEEHRYGVCAWAPFVSFVFRVSCELFSICCISFCPHI